MKPVVGAGLNILGYAAGVVVGWVGVGVDTVAGIREVMF